MSGATDDSVATKERFRFVNWCRTGRGATSLLLVLMTGFLLGYYGWRTMAAPPMPTYRLDFGNAQWIKPAEECAAGYFRKKFFINGEIEQAWIQVAATDSFRLFVNGAIISTGVSTAPSWTVSSISADPTLLWDVSKLLRPGTNAIAIEVQRSTYPGSPKLLVRLGIRQKTSQHEIVTDTSWKASLAPGIIPSLVSWQSPLCDDQHWPDGIALPGQATRDQLIQPQSLPPAIMQAAFTGKWIGDPQNAGDQATFTKRFDLPLDTKQTWLQISATGDYTLTLNGHWLGDNQRITTDLDWIYLQPFVRAKGNELSIRVRTYNKQAFALAQIASLGPGNRIVGSLIGSDSSWEMTTQGDKNGSVPRQAQEMGRFNYAGDNWGVPPASGTVAPLSYTEESMQSARGWLTLIATIIGVYLFWRFSAALLVRLKKYPPESALGFDAVLHFPVVLLLGFLHLLPYEIRLRPDWALRPEFFFAVVALLVGLRLLLWLFPEPKRVETAKTQELRPVRRRSFWQRRGFAVILGILVICAFVIRVRSIVVFPLDQDDIFIRNCAQGIFVRGYPSIDYGGISKRLTTYELVPYPIALSALIFGWTDWAVRIPSLLFGTFSTLLIAQAGKMFFSRRVGLFAAAVYAFLPWDCFWSLHCFHPQQTQFFSLLCICAFYAAIRRPDRINQKHFTRTCIFFCCTFLSWEGSGFLLPAFTMALLLLHPGRWGWLRERHFWLGLLVVGAVVMLQWASRTMALPPYIALGYGLADLSTPVLYFLDPECQPFYYVQSILTVTPYLLLTICFCGSLLMVGKSAGYRFCVVVYAVLLLSYSILLKAYSQRYGYFYQWILIVGASAVIFEIIRRVGSLSLGWKWWWGRWLTGTTAFAVLLLIFVSATNGGLMFYRLGGKRRDLTGMRYWLRWQDSASSARYVWKHWLPGDVVIGNLTQAFELYGGKLPDYGMDTLLSARVIYDNKRAVPRYEHRLTSIPIITDVPMTEQVMQRASRVWFVSAYETNVIPGPDTPPSIHNVITELLTRQSRIVFSCYSSRVYLYEGYTAVPENRGADLSVPPHSPLPADYGSRSRTALTAINPPFAQLPFKRPAKPNGPLDENIGGLVEPINTPGPDHGLIPNPGSLEPPRAPAPQSSP